MPKLWAHLNSVSRAPVTFTHTHTRLTARCPGLPGWASTRKVKPTWILLKQETVSGNGISWAICKSAPHSRQITMLAPHHSVFLQAGCPSCCPTNSVKALKAVTFNNYKNNANVFIVHIVRGTSEAVLAGQHWIGVSKLCKKNHFFDGTLVFARTPWVNKKQDTKLLPVTSPSSNRFSQFFRWQTQW